MEDGTEACGKGGCISLQLAPGQADDAPAAGGQAAVAGTVALEGERGVVPGAAVELGDQARVAPQEVAFERSASHVKPGAHLGGCFEQRPDRRGPVAAGVAGEQIGQRKRVWQEVFLGFMERTLELVRREHGREVEEGAWDGRDRDAPADRDLVGW